MFFALGVLVAGLLGLMILPALWRRAVRLSTRRLAMQTPLSMEEVLADRDLLRAEHAVAQHRLEERLTREQDARARDRAELGRKLAALANHSDILQAMRDDHARTQAQLAEARAQAADLQAQLGAALIEVHDGLSAREKYETLAAEARRHQHVASDRQLVLAGLETRLAGAEAKWRDAQRELAARDRRIAELDAALAGVRRKGAAAGRKRGSAPPAEDDAALRRSIMDLGDDVLRIAQAIERRSAPGDQTRPARSARAAVD